MLQQPKSNSSQQQQIILDDGSIPNQMFGFLKNKMASQKLFHPLPYSLDFQVNSIVKDGEKPFHLPYDVKISHQCGCILVSDSENECIQVIDLSTLKVKCTFEMNDDVRYLAV